MTQTIVQILILVISGVAVATLIVPQYERIGEIQAETADYREAVDNAYQLNQRLNALVNQATSLSQQERYRLERYIPDVLDARAAAFEIERLINRNNLFMSSIEVAEPVVFTDPVSTSAATEASLEDLTPSITNSKEMGTQDITLTVAGTYEQFKRLLADIEMSAQYMEIRSIDFAATGSDLLQFTMALRLYGLSNPEPDIQL